MSVPRCDRWSASPPLRFGRGGRGGFSQVEVAVSALITATVLAASLNLAGYVSRGQIQNNDQLRVRLIASGLMAEILALPFADPTQSPVFGPESGETTSPASRNLFDDVDDYHNWSSSVQTKSGTPVADFEGLLTTVHVSLADPNQLGEGAIGTNSAEVKRVTVRVLRGARTITELVGVVTK